MGNDTSILQAFTIQDEVYGHINAWNLHWAAKYKKDFNSHKNSGTSTRTPLKPDALVFTSRLKTYGEVPADLETCVEHLKRLRHPTVLRFLGSCCTGENFYLFTEPAKPLSMVLEGQTLFEICGGLHNIGLALQFLHETAKTVHNNIQEQSILVDYKGEWKLGGFDFACGEKDVTRQYLDQIRSKRPQYIIPPEEEQNSVELLPSACDVYALGVLTSRCISPCVEENFPHAEALLEYATQRLKHQNPGRRPSTVAFVQHSFFAHPYLQVKDFLSKLALKTSLEKEAFFHNLAKTLRHIPQIVIGQHLTESLLSRVVLLEPSAQKNFLPYFLSPTADGGDNSTQTVLNIENFRAYVCPVLAKILHVRDAEIRTVLLTFFSSYVLYFDRQTLEEDLLPELLLGIKDTHDDVVSATLRALADLVPILGSATVVGKRERIFSDGKPKAVVAAGAKSSPFKLTPNRKEYSSVKQDLPERIPPDGGEDTALKASHPEPVAPSLPSLTSAHHREKGSAFPVAEENEDWSDWDRAEDDKEEEEPEEADEDNSSLHNLLRLDTLEEALPPVPVLSSPASTVSTTKDWKKRSNGGGNLGEEFDIFSVKVSSKSEVDDLFADMEPKLVSPMILTLPGSLNEESLASAKTGKEETGKSKLAFQMNADDDEGEVSGWGSDLEWNEEVEGN